MAIIYSYPLNTPKRDDLLIGTITYDEDAVNPVHGNPTVSFTVGSLLDLIASQGAAQNLQQVTNIGNTTSNSIIISNNIKVSGGYYDSSNQPGTSGQLLSSTATGTQWVNVAAQGVTSVGLSMPTAFTVTNSPITQSGVLTVTGAGTAAQYINGLGNLVTFPTIPTQYVLPVATTVALGGIKIGYTETGKNYPLELDSEQAYVNVPWTDTVYTLPLAADGTRGGVQIGYAENAKNYPVELSSEKMFVNVPWTDTLYVLPVATSTDLGGVKIGYSTDATARNYAVTLDTEKMLVNVPWTDTQNPFQTITGTGTDNTDSGVLLSDSGGTVLILGDGSVTAAQTGNTITLTGTDTGITGVTLATADSTGAPLAESITTRELTITSSKYVGGANVGYVPEGGTSSTYLKGDGTWEAIPTGLIFKGTWDASGGGGGSPDLTLAANKGAGFLWICDVAGTAYPNGGTNEPSTWALGDWCVYDGSAWTRVPATNSGVTSVTTTDGTYIDLTPDAATTGAVTVTADLNAVDDNAGDTSTRFLTKTNKWEVPSYTGAGVTSLTSTKGTYIDITNNSTATGAVGLGTVDLNAVDGTSDTATKFLSKDNTWDVPSYTTDTNTIYDLENSGSGNTGDISLVTGDVVATADVNGASNTNSITYDNESPASGIVDGQIVRGTGIPAGTRVVSHTATVLTLNQIANVANNAVLSFHTADTVTLIGSGATVVDKNSGNIRITSTNTQNTYTAGAGLSVSNFVFSADIDTTAASSATNNLSTDAGKYYAVQLDNNATAADRKMVVNVPWSSGGTYDWTVKDNASNPGSSTVSSGDSIKFVTATGALGTVLTDPNSDGNFIMTLTSPDTNTEYSDFTGATAQNVGTNGLVVAPPAGAEGKFLRGDATWVNETTYSTFTGATSAAAGTSGLVPAPAIGDNVKFLKGDGTWAATPQGDITEIKTTAPITGAASSGIATIAINTMGAATASVAGTKGAVPGSAVGDQAKFLRADATWVVPTDTDTNTTYTIESADSKQISLLPSDVTITAKSAGNYAGVDVIQVKDISGTIVNGYAIQGGSIPAGVFITNVAIAGNNRNLTLSQNVGVGINTPLNIKARTAVTLADGSGISIAGNSDTITITNSDRDTGLPAIIVDNAQGSMSFGNANVTASSVRTKIGAGTGDGVVASLTTTGTTGAATLSNAGVLNIPNYANDNDNDYLTGLAFNTANGILTATVQNQSNVTVDLDGRYLTSYTVPLASATVRGGMKIGYTESGKNYPVELSSEKAYVNVPWANDNDNYYLDGITKSGNTLTFSVKDTTDQTYTFGSNAFNSSTIYAEPGIFSGGGTPTLATGVTAAEVRTLIGAGTGNGDITGVTAGTGMTGGGASGSVTLNVISGNGLTANANNITMSGSYTGNFTVTGDITASGGSAWLTAQGNVGGHNPPLSQGTALGWNYSGGSAEANLFFKGNTTDHANNQLRIQSYNGTGATEVIRIHGNKLVDFRGNISAQGTTILTNSGATSYLAANKYTLIGNHSNPSNTAATFYDQSGQGPTISGFAVCFRTGSTPAQTGKLNSSGTFTVSGDIVAYGSPSDIRLKENIKPIESALDKVSKLQGVTFNWKNKSENILDIKEDIGFIAQDVKKVLPELVRENDNGMLSMRHQGITPILLEAIKELKAEIEELKLNNCNCNK